MRLDKDQKKALKKIISIAPKTYKFFLFGSRTKDNTKGGDVDILVQASDNDKKKHYNRGLRMMREYQNIVDEKIDIVIMPKNRTTEQNNFLDIIKSDLITLE